LRKLIDFINLDSVCIRVMDRNVHFENYDINGEILPFNQEGYP